MGIFGDKITEEALAKFIKFVEEEIFGNKDELDDYLENYIQNIVYAVKIYDAENTCGCTQLTEEDKKFRDYILYIANGLGK